MSSGWRSRYLVLALVAWTATAGAEPVPSARVGFTVLQINDTYKIEGLEAGRIGGLARLRTLRRALEAEGRPLLVLHGGDLLFPSVMSRYLKGEPMIAALNRLDGSEAFDERLFVTFGNHEFEDADPAVLLDRLRQSRFTWLGSHVSFRLPGMAAAVPLAGHAPNVVATSLIEIGGVRLGLFGLTLVDPTHPWTVEDSFERRVETAAAAVAELCARGAEVVIAVTHQELGDDELLAARVPGIDWIVGGHEHVALERQVGKTWITKADADAKSAVRIDFDAVAGAGSAAPAGAETVAASKIRARHSRIALDLGVAPDPEMLGEVARWLVRLEQRVFERTGRRLLEVVASTEHALEGVEPKIRGRETALGNFLTDLLRARLETEIALVNGGSIRVNDDVPAGGELRVYELEGIFYYDNRPVAFELTGAELLELLRKSVSQATLGHGRFLQLSGARFSYRARATESGERTAVVPEEVQVWNAEGWRPLELSRVYSVAAPDWLWKNGCRDGYPRFGAGCGGESPKRLERPELSFRAITEETIARLPGRRISTAIDGRIVRIDAATAEGER